MTARNILRGNKGENEIKEISKEVSEFIPATRVPSTSGMIVRYSQQD